MINLIILLNKIEEGIIKNITGVDVDLSAKTKGTTMKDVTPMTEDEKKALMINCAARTLDDLENIINDLQFTPEEKSTFMMNIMSFIRCLFIHAYIEQMKLTNEDKWNTLKILQEMDRVGLRDIMKKDRLKYNH